MRRCSVSPPTSDEKNGPAARKSWLFEELCAVDTPNADVDTDPDTDVENPYWQEPPPHPAPEQGCIRRGLCCRSSPGWFAPGEAERAAELLGMAPDAFAKQYLVIDACDIEGHGRVEVFAPVKLDRFGQPALRPLTRVDELYRILRGVCVFFEEGGCRIYAARPIECRRYVCTNPPEENLDHETIARMWQEAAGAPEEA
jgi:Fe-S-cluster containining protein